MSTYTASSNMSLPVPTVGIDPGPDYATNINTCMTLIDSHDHSNGKGVTITPAGITINQTMSFAGYSIKDIASLVMNVQASVSTSNSIYVKLVTSNNELFYKDSSGNDVQITSNGGVNGTPGTITGLPSGTAGVDYSTGTFTFSEATNTPGNIAAGSIKLGNNTALSKYLTLSPPAGMAADYSLVLPSIPGATSIAQVDTSGNITAVLVVDNSSLQNTGTVLSVKAGGITRAKLAAGIGEWATQAITTSQTVTVPAGVTAVYFQAIGGGGGGGGGGGASSTSGNGAGGGAAGSWVTRLVSTSGGEAFAIVIGTGGSGGAGQVNANGLNGSAGTSTTIKIGSTFYLIAPGGNGGGFGPVGAGGAVGGPGGSGLSGSGTIASAGGAGGQGNTGSSSSSGVAGQGSIFINTGGVGGINAGSGGGGAAGLVAGSDGAAGPVGVTSGVNANNAPANSGAGGGGGSGSTAVAGVGGNGGSGGSGIVYVSWIV